MAYDEGLAHRIREILEDQVGASEKKMFGGLCFLVNGHMACGIVKSELMVRVGPAAHDHALALPHSREMDFTGRALKGMVYVGEAGIAEDDDLQAWIGRGVQHAESLPPKGVKKKAAQKKVSGKKTQGKKTKGRKKTARKNNAVKRTAAKKRAVKKQAVKKKPVKKRTATKQATRRARSPGGKAS